MYSLKVLEKPNTTLSKAVNLKGLEESYRSFSGIGKKPKSLDPPFMTVTSLSLVGTLSCAGRTSVSLDGRLVDGDDDDDI